MAKDSSGQWTPMTPNSSWSLAELGFGFLTFVRISTPGKEP
jgi:hypothetical protein